MELLTSDCILLPIIFASLFYVPFSNVRPGPYVRWLQLQCRSGLTGVCIAAVSQLEGQWRMHPSFGSNRIELPPDKVFVVLWPADVEKVRKMITKSRKSWGIYSMLQDTMDWMTVIMHMLHMIHPSWRWFQRSRDLQEVSPMIIVCLFAGIHWTVILRISCNW